MKSDSQAIDLYELVLCKESKTVLPEMSVCLVHFYYDLVLFMNQFEQFMSLSKSLAELQVIHFIMH